jgi:TRAP-type C4-dicarboxylate transport system permease small subunit
MTVFVESFRPRRQLLFHTIVSAVCFAGFSGITYFLGKYAIKIYNAGDVTPNLHIPRAIPYSFLTVCFVWLCVCLAVETGLYLTAFIKYDDKKASEALTGKVVEVESAEKIEIGGVE